MVPGSTFRYGSHFWRVTRSPRLSSRQPIEAAATPLPSEETTPPVTKIYFGVIRAVWRSCSSASALNCFASSKFFCVQAIVPDAARLSIASDRTQRFDDHENSGRYGDRAGDARGPHRPGRDSFYG